ncbi:MAG: CRISPR-associated endonuclease Cas2 [Verrucomicrobiales bacterium]
MARRALTNTRRLFLCTYDVASDRAGDKRRRHLYELLLDHGEHVQYSVFLCEMTSGEQTRLVSEARRILHDGEDQLLVVDIGPENFDWTGRLNCLGKPWTPQVRSFIV